MYKIDAARSVWLKVYRGITRLAGRMRVLKGAVTVKGAHGPVTAPPPSAYRLLLHLGIASTCILLAWCFTAQWESLDRHQSFLAVLLQPFFRPVPDSLVDITIRIGLCLGIGFGCLLTWIIRLEQRVGNTRANLRVRMMEKSGRQVWIELTEPHDGAWPAGMAEALAIPGAHIAWFDDRDIVVEIPHLGRPQIRFHLNAPLDANDLVVRDQSHDW